MGYFIRGFNARNTKDKISILLHYFTNTVKISQVDHLAELIDTFYPNFTQFCKLTTLADHKCSELKKVKQLYIV